MKITIFRDMKITKNTTLERLLSGYPESTKVLARHGMRSISCPDELTQPLWRVAESRDMPIDKLVNEIRELIDIIADDL